MNRWSVVVVGLVAVGCGTRVATVREPVAVSHLTQSLPRRWLTIQTRQDTLVLTARRRRHVRFEQPVVIDQPTVVTGATWRFDTAAAVVVPEGGSLRLVGTTLAPASPTRRWKGLRVSDGGQFQATTRTCRHAVYPTVISGARCAIFVTAADTTAAHLPMIMLHQTHILDSDTGVWLYRLEGWHLTSTVYTGVESRLERCQVGWAATQCQVPLTVATHIFAACRTGIVLRENGLAEGDLLSPLRLPVTVERNLFTRNIFAPDLPAPVFNDGIVSTLNRNVNLTIRRNTLDSGLPFAVVNGVEDPGQQSTGIRLAEGGFLANCRARVDDNDLRGYHTGIAASGFAISPLVPSLDQTRLTIANNRITGAVGIHLAGLLNNSANGLRFLV